MGSLIGGKYPLIILNPCIKHFKEIVIIYQSLTFKDEEKGR